MLAFAHRHRDIYQPIEEVEPDLVCFLQSQPFPGNVRELENDVQRMLFSKPSGTSLGMADWHRRSAVARTEENPDLLGEAAAKVWAQFPRREFPTRRLSSNLSEGYCKQHSTSRAGHADKLLNTCGPANAHSTIRYGRTRWEAIVPDGWRATNVKRKKAPVL